MKILIIIAGFVIMEILIFAKECFAMETRCLDQCHVLRKERNRESV